MKASDNPFPSTLFAEQASNPATPAAGYGRLFVKSDGVYFIDDAGTVTGPFGAGGGGGSTFVGARANRSTTQSVPDATWTAVAFDAEDFDTNTFHDTATNPSRFTVPTGYAGKYRVTGLALWEANTTAQRYRAIAKNGIRIAPAVVNATNNNTNGFGFIVDDIVSCAVGDYLEMHVYQDSTAARNIIAGSYLALQYLGA